MKPTHNCGSRQRKARYRNRRGAMVVLIAISIVVLLIGAMFSVDIAQMHVVRAELRTATDAAARAGAGTLARTQNPAKAVAAAREYARKNKVSGSGLNLADSDIELGGISANGSRFDFQPNTQTLAAVRVHGRRTADSPDGTVPLFFGKLFSVNEFAPTQTATGAANVRDIALVLDVSGSMATRMGSVTRLQALKKAVKVFLDEIRRSSPQAQVSLSVYSTTAAQLIPLTEDLDLIHNTTERLGANGFTAIGLGLQSGVNSLLNDPLSRPHANKAIVILTDGQHNTGIHPLIAVAAAVANQQTVHTITFSDDANQSLMQNVAQATQGGQHFHANDEKNLAKVFETIARRLSVLLIE
jgi:Ca-activated chloride channel homolog